MTDPEQSVPSRNIIHAAYPAARSVVPKILSHFGQHHSIAKQNNLNDLASLPDERIVEAIVDVAFWTSLRREENTPPRISFAFLPPEQANPSLRFENPIALNATTLTKLAPGIERPGIHLGVWEFNGELIAWGLTRNVPPLCFIVETVAPGMIIVKHRQIDTLAKFMNVAVLEGDQIKILDHEVKELPGCSSILRSFLNVDSNSSVASTALIRLAISMREHKRGGLLLVVPRGTDEWRHSASSPISYSVNPPFTELSDVIRSEPDEQNKRRWRDALFRAVEAVAGLTAIDGATVITEDCEVLAFGVKIIRRQNSLPLERVALTEPIEGATVQIVHPGQLGGTRHFSGAQFASDQPNAYALVASQDGPFTIFSSSKHDGMVYGYRVETLLL